MHKSRVFVGFDRLFARMGGLPFKESDVAALAMVAAGSVMAELSAREICEVQGGEKEKEKNLKIAFTGNIAFEEVKKLLSEMGLENKAFARCVPNILRDPGAVPAVMEADYVILVEAQERSTYSEIERELEQLLAWKKKVLGVVVVDVDAIP